MHRSFIPEEKYLIKLSVCSLGKFNAYNKTARRNNTTYLHDGFFFVVMEKLQSTLAEETFFFFTDVLKTFFLDNTLPT